MDEQKVTLPPMPEPDGAADVVVGTQLVDGGMIADVLESVDAWSEPLVREYARLAVLAERDRCAKLTDKATALRALNGRCNPVEATLRAILEGAIPPQDAPVPPLMEG